jgi:hypothetical protein
MRSIDSLLIVLIPSFFVNPNGDYSFDLTEVDVAIACN